MAAALKRENMERTAAQVRRIMVASAGDAPSERTLQRHFAREDLAAPRGAVVFGRFEADLEQLNGWFTTWVEHEYHVRVHSSTGAAPLARWSAGTPRFTGAAELDAAFLQ